MKYYIENGINERAELGLHPQFGPDQLATLQEVSTLAKSQPIIVPQKFNTIVRPIETVYKKVKFRSRVEARWAVYFDAIGITWQYEKEGYDLGDGLYYLPDFWLSQVDMWAEVKPGQFSPIELEKAKRLVKGTGFSLIMLEGQPTCRSYEVVSVFWINDEDELMLGDGNDCVISNYHDYPQTENRFFGGTGWGSPYGSQFNDVFGPNGDFKDVPPAVQKALSARFEHGEKG